MIGQRATVVCAGVCLLLAAAGSAQARETPRLSTLDHPGDREGLFFDPALLLGDGFDFGFRFDLRAEVALGRGAGVAFDVDATHVSYDQGGETALSNLALQAFVRRGLGQGGVFIGRFGATIGVAPGGLAGAANALSHRVLLQDYALAVPDAFALRLGASALKHTGGWFFRGDTGIDIFLANAGDTYSPFVHIGGAAGYDAGAVAFALEFANLLSFEENAIMGDDFSHTLAITATFPAGWYGSIVIPLDSPVRGDLWALQVGLFALSW